MRSEAETARRRRQSRARMPSSTGYMIAAVLTALGLFFALWWMLVSGGDEAPWLPAGLAASVVLLVALSAREVVMRRAWTRYLLENGISEHSGERARSSHTDKKSHSSALLSAALRAIQKQSIEADSAGSSPESHLEVFHLCQDYLAGTDEALRSSRTGEKSIAMRTGQERVRSLQKHHMLSWARETSVLLTREAQQRARTSDKIETANRALDSLDSALKIYPNEPELNESALAIKEFIASVKVAHWVELAERSAFKGHFKRAIDRYKDALLYLNRETVKEEVRLAGEERIGREIQALRSKLKSSNQPREPKMNGGDGVTE
jgi:hypothetical protein